MLRTSARLLLLFVALLSTSCVTVTTDDTPVFDGPYIVFSNNNAMDAWYADTNKQGALVKRSEPVKAGDRITIAAVGVRPAFRVTLRAPTLDVAPNDVPLPPGTAQFFLADTHGQYEIATELLIRHGIINAKLRWTFGRGHLVVLGDVFDRGERQVELFWLLYQLEAEAQAAGGAVHLLLGNHEAMVLNSDQRYLHPRYAQVAAALNVADYADLWSADTFLGRWLRTKATVQRIGGVLCLHGGVSADMIENRWSLADINDTVRAYLNKEKDQTDPNVSFVLGPIGPLWYRGYFPGQRNGQQSSRQEVDAVRDFYKVTRIAVGHTPVDSVMLLYGGAVVAVQVYMERDASGAIRAEGAFVDGTGTWYRAKIDGTREPLTH